MNPSYYTEWEIILESVQIDTQSQIWNVVYHLTTACFKVLHPIMSRAAVTVYTLVMSARRFPRIVSEGPS